MKYSRLLSLSLVLFFSVINTYAAVPKLSKAGLPKWIRTVQKTPTLPDLADINDGYYIESIDYQVHIASQTRFNRIVKVLTEDAGAEYAGQVSIPFVPDYQKLIFHELYIIRDGKRIDRLDLQEIKLMAFETELSRSIYNGTYSAYILLEDLGKNDKVVISYSIQGFNPVFEGKFFDTFYLQTYEPLGLVHVNYIVPKGRNLTFKSYKEAPVPTRQEQGNDQIYFVEIINTQKVDFESDVPAWYPTLQRIECSEFKDWSDVSSWAQRVNPIPDIKNSAKLKHFADEIWDQAKGDSYSYAREITDYVQNKVRYMGIEVGEYSHRANNPEKVFTQKYGDCKDKSVLLASLLNYKGLTSTLVLANTLEKHNLDQILASPSAFNHMVLITNINGVSQYIDPTMTNQGGSFEDRYFPYYGKVLILDSRPKLANTERYLPGSTKINEKFHIQQDGSAVLEVFTLYKGANADHIRNYFKQVAKNQISRAYLEYYQKRYKSVSEKEPLSFIDNFNTNECRVSEKYIIKDYIEKASDNNRKLVNIYAIDIGDYLPQVKENRTLPIALPYPASIEHTIYLINPNGKDAPLMQEYTFFDRESYSFRKNFINSKDTLKVSFILNIHDTFVKEPQVQEYINDFSNRDVLLSNAIYLDDNGNIFGSNNSRNGGYNIKAILSFLGLIALLTWIISKFYHKRKASNIISLGHEISHDQIQGWLIVLGWILVLNVFIQLFRTMILLGFKNEVWETLQVASTNTFISLHSLFILEFIANTIIIFLFGYCSYLLIKRRDIFPQTFLGLLVFQLLVIIMDTWAAWAISPSAYEQGTPMKEIFKTVGFSTIWAAYLFRSERVKGTFLVQSKEQQTSDDHYSTEFPINDND